MKGYLNDDDLDLEYDSTKPADPIKIRSTFTDWDTYFFNDEIANCPITSCALYDDDCSTPYSGTHVVMGTSSPWSITMDRTIISGIS